jgi:CheY-like chemotaxis protein
MNKLDTVLLVSDSQQNRKLLRSVLAESYHTLEAANASQALSLWKQNISCIAAVIADITSNHSIDPLLSDIPDRVPLILLCREDSAQILNQGFNFGAADVIPPDYDPDAMLRHSNDTMVGALSSII